MGVSPPCTLAPLHPCTPNAKGKPVPNIIVPSEALENWAQAQIEDLPTLNDCRLRLFRTSNPIDADTTLAELEAAESDFEGYASVPLVGWTDATVIDGKAITEADTVSFTATATDPQDVYGCFATTIAGDKLWWAEKFTTPIPTPYGVDLQVDTSIDLASIFSS